MQVNSDNVGRIAERIVANELEFRGFRVSDLNSSRRLAPNADLLAVSKNITWLFQVKGAANANLTENWWVNYAHANQAMVDDPANTVFNQKESYYVATHAVLVAVRSPVLYTCIVMPIAVAERAAQMNLDRYYRKPSRAGTARKPHKMYVNLEPAHAGDPELVAERAFLAQYRDELGWSKLAEQAAAAASI